MTELGALRARLSGGVARDTPRAFGPRIYSDDYLWSLLEAPLRELWALDSPSRDRAPAEVEAAIQGFSAFLAHGVEPEAGLSGRERAERQVRELVSDPSRLLDLAEPCAPQVRWARMCLAAEAVWRRVDDAEAHEAELTRLRPLAARLRFLLLTEPFRYRGVDKSVWHPTDVDHSAGAAHGAVSWAFGENTQQLLLDRVRAARREWLTCLNAYQSHSVLVQARPSSIEAELREAASARGYGTGPLVLSPRPVDEPDPPGSEDLAMAQEVAERHLLPRFKVGQVALLVGAPAPVHRGDTEQGWWPRLRGLARRCWEFRRHAASVLPEGVFLAVLWFAFAEREFWPAALLGALGYLAIGAGVVWLGRLWAARWLLRIPAAAAIGLVPLAAFPDWWQHARLSWPLPSVEEWAPLVVLFAAPLGYLVVEARNHGVATAAALRRSLGIAAIGTAHAFAVALIGLVAVVPAFAARGGTGTELVALWTGGPGDAVAVLLLATGWCLAVGVFSQILWDDRPITAPLAHLHWRGDG